jgi:predicted nucleic acid-binding protein
MPGVVSDSSTLILLAVLDRVALLQEFYGQVLVPPAVWREVVEEGQGRAGVREVEDAARSGWLTVIGPTNEALLRLLKRNLDDGEAESVALAIERRADVILLDESDARKVAGLYGLSKTGVLGLLIRARLEGKLPSLRQDLARLREQAGFWIDEDLYQQALEVVGEGVE